MSKSFQIWNYFFPLLFSKDSKNLKSLDIGFWEVGEKRLLNWVRNTNTKKILLSKAKLAEKLFFLRGNFTPFNSKIFQIWDHFFITFHQGFQVSKIFGHPTLGSGGKKMFKLYLKSEFEFLNLKVY